MGCLNKGKSAERPAVTVNQVEIVCESVALNPKKETKVSLGLKTQSRAGKAPFPALETKYPTVYLLPYGRTLQNQPQSTLSPHYPVASWK